MAKISNNEMAQAIYQSVKGKTGHALLAQLQKVVEILNTKRLLSQAPQILASLRKIINKEEGIVEAKVSFAGKLTPNAKAHIEHALKKRYKAKDVVLHDMEDKSLIGGFKIEVGDELLDLSIRNKINKLQEHLITQ
jgi:F-type H+-transporting ATPase subunit delta